jgi:hypothetical protein
LLALFALGVIALAFFGSRLGVAYTTPLSGCALESGTGGASGVFRWAQRMGIPTELLEDPLWEVSESLGDGTGHCAMTFGNGSWSPIEDALESESWQSIRRWLARGNTLVVVTAEPAHLPAVLRRDLIPAAVIETAAATRSLSGELSVESRPETTGAPVKSGGTLVVESKGPRWNVAAPGGTGPAAAKKEPPPRAGQGDPAGWQLAGEARGGVLFRIPVDQGAVYVLLDDFAWTNAGFDQGDNARVLAEILGHELRGGVLAFDEYRHGHGRAESFLSYLLKLPGSSAALWIGAIWVLLYSYGRNVRLKPVEPFVERQRRTAQEYIDAVAQLYERARAAPLVVEAVARRLRQVARSSAEAAPAVEEVLHRAAEYTKTADRPAAPTAATLLVKKLIQLRKRIYGTRTVS